jgi:hypothetical protein
MEISCLQWLYLIKGYSHKKQQKTLVDDQIIAGICFRLLVTPTVSSLAFEER